MKSSETSDQWTKMHREVSLLKEENARLTREKEDLITDLEECKIELFRRLPPTQISDDSIQKAVIRIRGSIDNFVYEVMGDIAEDALYNLCQRKQQKQKQRQKRKKIRNRLSTFIKKEDISLWGPYECSNFYILSVIIQWVLDEHIFENRYPLGTTSEQIGVMEEVEESMSQASQSQS